MSAQRETQSRLAAPDISALKGKTPIVCLTAYTAPMASLLDEACDILLVGDSGRRRRGAPASRPARPQAPASRPRPPRPTGRARTRPSPWRARPRGPQDRWSPSSPTMSEGSGHCFSDATRDRRPHPPATECQCRRRAFRLHKFEGLSHAETAAAMGISRSAVEKHISTALRLLLTRLNP